MSSRSGRPFLCHDVICLVFSFMRSEEVLVVRNLSKSFADASREAFPVLKLLSNGSLEQEWLDLRSWMETQMQPVNQTSWFDGSDLEFALATFNERYNESEIDNWWWDTNNQSDDPPTIVPLYLPLPQGISAWICWTLNLQIVDGQCLPFDGGVGIPPVVLGLVLKVLDRVFLNPAAAAPDSKAADSKKKPTGGQKMKIDSPQADPVTQKVENQVGMMVCHTGFGAHVEGSTPLRSTIPRSAPAKIGPSLEAAFEAFVKVDPNSEYFGPFMAKRHETLVPGVATKWWTAFYLRISAVDTQLEVGVLVFNADVNTLQ